MEPQVTDNPGKSRFEITVGGELAGFAEYHRFGDELAFLHTEIAAGFEGQGLGSRLARAALDSAREQQVAVLPYCSFIRDWIGKHPDYLDLVPEAQLPRFGF